jgi:hypothetical protein
LQSIENQFRIEFDYSPNVRHRFDMKLTRKQIKEGLEQTPIEAVILGAVNPSGVRLTSKEKRFAEEMAKGATKSDAYRIAYNPKGNRHTVNKRAHEVSKREGVLGYSEAIKGAVEAQRFATPAHLRALTIHKLTEGALDPEMPPAQRVKCLELLGKITEVALFTERREVIKVDDSAKARAALMASIKAALDRRATDVDYRDALELMSELEAGPEENAIEADPPTPHPPRTSEEAATPLHSNPHIESPDLVEKIPGTKPIVFSDKDA